MTPIARALLVFIASHVRSRVSLQVEILVLQHQLAVSHRPVRRPRVCSSDRILWSWLVRVWSRWREVLVFGQTATALAWQRRRFRNHWARLRRRHPGPPAIPGDCGGEIHDREISHPPAKAVLPATSNITNAGGSISRWPWIVPSPDPSYRPSGGVVIPEAGGLHDHCERMAG